jgi:translation initiation factor 2 alpha subunit (eIF-2alpha)
MEKITIEGIEFYVEKPTCARLDQLKDLTGIDMLKGMTEEDKKKISQDFRTVAKLAALLLGTKSEKFKSADDKEKFIYENMTVMEFGDVISFFMKQFAGNSQNTFDRKGMTVLVAEAKTSGKKQK